LAADAGTHCSAANRSCSSTVNTDGCTAIGLCIGVIGNVIGSASNGEIGGTNRYSIRTASIGIPTGSAGMDTAR